MIPCKNFGTNQVLFQQKLIWKNQQCVTSRIKNYSIKEILKGILVIAIAFHECNKKENISELSRIKNN